jgi:hypothetical protein
MSQQDATPKPEAPIVGAHIENVSIVNSSAANEHTRAAVEALAQAIGGNADALSAMALAIKANAEAVGAVAQGLKGSPATMTYGINLSDVKGVGE